MAKPARVSKDARWLVTLAMRAVRLTLAALAAYTA